MKTENVAPYIMAAIAAVIIAWTMIATMQKAVPETLPAPLAPQTYGLIDFIPT